MLPLMPLMLLHTCALAGHALVLYELSTGNTFVESLAWHVGSATLLAACESLQENRLGQCYKSDFKNLEKSRSLGFGGGAGAGAADMVPVRLQLLALELPTVLPLTTARRTRRRRMARRGCGPGEQSTKSTSLLATSMSPNPVCSATNSAASQIA